jgi:hypothetical protein
MYILENDNQYDNTVYIPKELLSELYDNLSDNYITLELSYYGTIHVFSDISVSEIENTVIAPGWIMNKLGCVNLDEVEIKAINYLENINKIYLQSNNSLYAKVPDIKERIEEYFIRNRVGNLGDIVIISDSKNKYEFYITKLENENSNEINRGKLLGNDVKLEFMKPYDVLEEERKKEIEEKLAREKEEKEIENQRLEDIERNKYRKPVIYQPKPLLHPELLSGLIFGRKH